MHFYTDLNIYGLKNIYFRSYKFRKNLDYNSMESLKKVNFRTINNKEYNNEYLDLINLYSRKPFLFSLFTLPYF